MLAPGTIIIWPSTNASIPAGFSRVTGLDGRFVKATAAGVDPNVTGGNATHSHTSPAHSHTMNSHSHTIVTNTVCAQSSNSSDGNGTEQVGGGCHSHTYSLAGVVGGGLSSVTSTYASVSNNPPYYEVIFIQANAYRFVPAGAVVLWAGASLPTGFSLHAGLKNKYPRGAGAGNDSGATGGSYTNIHDLVHTHVESSHYHSQSLSGQITDAGGYRGTSGGNRVARLHAHTFTLNSNTAGSISSVQLTTVETVEPAYKKLAAIQNGDTPKMPRGVIAMWLGSLASIPPGWFLCDGNNGTPDMRGKFLKIANDLTEVGNTGGSNTHTHAAQGHTHSGGSHTHTGQNTASHSNATGAVGGTWTTQDGGVGHSISTVSSETVSWASANTTADSADNQPEFRTVAFIYFKYPIGGLANHGML